MNHLKVRFYGKFRTQFDLETSAGIPEGRMSASRVGRCIRIDLRLLEEIGEKGSPEGSKEPTENR